MLLQAPEIDVVGIGIVAGDGQVKASTAWTLRMLELTGYGHIPVAQGAKFPLVNSREETELWEAQFGVFGYKGAWNPAAIPQSRRGSCSRARQADHSRQSSNMPRCS